MFIASQWQDFEVLDTGNGEKLERWGNYLLARPDPQTIWPPALPKAEWQEAHAHYSRSERGGGAWAFRRPLPEEWTVAYRDLSFYVRGRYLKVIMVNDCIDNEIRRDDLFFFRKDRIPQNRHCHFQIDVGCIAESGVIDQIL